MRSKDRLQYERLHRQARAQPAFKAIGWPMIKGELPSVIKTHPSSEIAAINPTDAWRKYDHGCRENCAITNTDTRVFTFERLARQFTGDCHTARMHW